MIERAVKNGRVVQRAPNQNHGHEPKDSPLVGRPILFPPGSNRVALNEPNRHTTRLRKEQRKQHSTAAANHFMVPEGHPEQVNNDDYWKLNQQTIYRIQRCGDDRIVQNLITEMTRWLSRQTQGRNGYCIHGTVPWYEEEQAKLWK